MNDISLTRLYLLRAFYAFASLGLIAHVWPHIIAPPDLIAHHSSVVRALLGALALVFALGIRYPLKMLPILLFELLWKLIWVLGSALPMWLGPGLDDYATETFYACLMGVVLVPLVIPWRYTWRRYVLTAGDRWLKSNPEANAAKV